MNPYLLNILVSKSLGVLTILGLRVLPLIVQLDGPSISTLHDLYQVIYPVREEEEDEDEALKHTKLIKRFLYFSN